jgi:hypothetical protein
LVFHGIWKARGCEVIAELGEVHFLVEQVNQKFTIFIRLKLNSIRTNLGHITLNIFYSDVQFVSYIIKSNY